MEAFLSNTDCFLAETSWANVLGSAISSDDSDLPTKQHCSDLWRSLVHGPTLFKAVTIAIFTPWNLEHTIEELIDLVEKSRQGLLRWLRQALQMQSMQPRLSEACTISVFTLFEMLERGLGVENPTLLTLKGTFVMCYMTKVRLLFSLAPSRYYHLELECQRLATEIMRSKQHQDRDQDGQLVWSSTMSQSEWIAKGVLATRKAWGEGWEDRHGLIEKWKFKAWCKSIGRLCPSE
jgi:hypothetical protein